MKNTRQSSKNHPKRNKSWTWISKFSWLLFLKGTICFQGFGWEVELQYQPFFENGVLTELLESLNPDDISNSTNRDRHSGMM